MSEPAPGEAHARLGIVERRHMVLRDALEKYMEYEQISKTKDDIRDALTYVAPAINQLTYNKGYTPSQWVLNTNPRDATSLTYDS